MDFEEIKRIPLGDVTTAIVKEGGAVTGGLLLAGAAGRQVENMLMGITPVTTTSTLGDKVKAAGANLAPKVAAWYLLRGRTGAAEDARKGVVTSAAFDLLMRLTNNGVNPAIATVMGYQILGSGDQNLAQENAVLKAELNKAVKQLSALGAGGQIKVQEVPYAPVPPPYPLAERKPTYGFMPGTETQAAQPIDPRVARRQQRWGFAGEQISASENIAKMFGML